MHVMEEGIRGAMVVARIGTVPGMAGGMGSSFVPHSTAELRLMFLLEADLFE